MTGVLRVPRRAALITIAILVAAASLVSFAESYRGLYLWAHHHGLTGLWAVAWPLQIDTFIGVGELALFVALADRWAARSRAGAWLVTGLGLAVSVVGNIGHVAGPDLAARATAAVPPLAAAAALAVGLGVLKRVVGAHHATVPEHAPAPVPDRAATPASKRAAARAPKHANDRAPVTKQSAELAFGAQLVEGTVPSLREVKRTLGLGTDRARQVRDHLAEVAR